jgi:predicted phosphodiesterase
MKDVLKTLTVLILALGCEPKPSKSIAVDTDFRIGLIADCQYCDCETRGKRHYRASKDRLAEAVKTLNNFNLKYTIHTGDFIDRDFKSYDTLLPIWNQLKSKKYHVLGNHDFEVEETLRSSIFEKLNIQNRYYSFSEGNWRFIVLDGNDLSFHGGLTEEKKKQTDSLYNSLKDEDLEYMQKWNGGLSQMQLNWVKSELELATKNKERVGFYCHFPIYPEEIHNLWNRKDLMDLISQYSCVKLYINGHNHAGAYEAINGIHFLTLKGMVETADNSSFAMATFSKDTVLIRGYGREISRKLVID